jgi:RNA polymerase sigma-70 factor (ECF subfamily)
MYEEESIKEIKQLYQEERGFLQAEEDASDEELGKLLKCLSEEDKDLFYRRYVKEQSVAQISVETGLHRDRIYSRISKGKKKIRKFFKDKDYGGEGNETRI